MTAARDATLPGVDLPVAPPEPFPGDVDDRDDEQGAGPLVRVDDVTFTYLGETEPALSEVRFGLEAGRVLGVLGPIGAGKTTLCMCLAGLMPRVFGGRLTGHIRVAGLDPRQARTSEVADRVGIVFEDYAAQLTQVRVLDEVAAPLENRGVPPEQARDHARAMLARLGLDDPAVIGKRTWELSGGQQQRIAIAASLATEPQVLILDNVTAMLDPAGKQEIRRSIADLGGSGTTLVVVDNDPDLLHDVADRVLLLSGGRVVAEGATPNILSDDQTLTDAGVALPAPLHAARALRLPASPLTDREFQQAAAGIHAAHTARTAPARRPPPDEAASRLPTLDVREVGYRYPDGTLALEQASLQVRAGEVHGLLGGNGAGKTTLAKIVVGLVTPTSGSVTVDGRDAAATRAVDLATTVGTAFQKPDEQLSERTVADEIAFGLRARRYEKAGWFSRRERYGEDFITERVQWACSLAGIEPELLGRDPTTLPFGQRKLVTLAAAVALDPPVVVLDEPATGLDAAAHCRVEAMVTTLAQAGKAVILVEHEIDLVGELTDTVTILNRGSVAAQGHTREVFAQPNWNRLYELHMLPPRPARLGAAIGVDALTYTDLTHLTAARPALSTRS